MQAQFREAFKLALSMVLFYGLALWMNWDLPKYGALAMVLVDLGTTGASLRKGAMRLVGTAVGVAVGMLGLALFAQERSLNLAFLCSYLVLVSYFMQASPYRYAWYVAGFLPALIWATTYGDVDNAFHYASFRYLETSVGLVIYTLVCVILWPQKAGDALDRQGEDFWPGLRKLFGLYRRHLAEGQSPAETAETAGLQAQLAGRMAQMQATLQAASVDTPAVIARKPAWQTVGGNLRALADALVLWNEGLDDCRRLDLGRLLPRLEDTLEAVDARLASMDDAWRARSAGDDAAGREFDPELLSAMDLSVDRAVLEDLSHYDRAAVLGFVQQLNVLDRTSRELLHTLWDLADRDLGQEVAAPATAPAQDRPPLWDPARLVPALFPAVSMAIAFVFWVLFDPPPGPKTVSFAAIISLMAVMSPMNVLGLLPWIAGVIVFAVAPVYFLVMPRLDSGLGLLALIFGYTFAAGVLAARSPLLKMWSLVLFVMMTGISNQHQVYSFMGLVNGALMFLLAIGIVGIVQILLSPIRPEEILLRDVRRFFEGCTRLMGELARRPGEEWGPSRALRMRTFEAMVAGVPARLGALQKKLDYEHFRANDEQKVQRLVGSMQSMANRFRALERAHDRLALRSVQWAEPVARIGQQLQSSLRQVFVKWSRFEPVDLQDERSSMQDLSRELESLLDAPTQDVVASRLDEDSLADAYAMLGCARGLVRAVGDMHLAWTPIDWDAWAEARF